MKSKINIDTLLAKDSLELTVGGKTYVVADLEVEHFLNLSSDEKLSDPDAMGIQLAAMLGIKRSELVGVGMRAMALAIRSLQTWLMGADAAAPSEDVETVEDKKADPLV